MQRAPGAPGPAAAGTAAPAHISVQSQTDDSTPKPSQYLDASTSIFREETGSNLGSPLPGASNAAKRKSLFPSPSSRKSIHVEDTCTTPMPHPPEENSKKARLDNFLGSPFYPGQTMYGGASASRMYMREPNIISRRTPIVTPPLCNDNNSVSTAVSRMEKLLEKYSSPLNESKRTPQVRANASDLNSSLLGSTISPSRNLPKLQELRTSHTVMMLNIKRRARLRDSTQAARQIYMSHSSTTIPDPAKTVASLGGYGTSNTTNKIKSHIGKSQARRNANNLEDEIVPPLNLPSMALPITNLPQFSFPKKQATITSTSTGDSSQKEESKEESSSKTQTFVFSKPIQIEVHENHIPADTSKFTFRKPEHLENVNEGQSSAKPTFSSVLPKSTENAVGNVKDWICNDCWVNNKSDIKKCVACGGAKTSSESKQIISTINVVPTKKDWKCDDCWVMNKFDIQKCVACGGNKPSSEPKVITNTINAVTNEKDWKCDNCWVMNKFDTQKCVACGGIKPTSEPKAITSTINAVPNEKDWKCDDCWVMNKPETQKCVSCGVAKPRLAPKHIDNYAQKENDWKCDDCWIMNKPDVSKCVACGGAKPNIGSKPSTVTENSLPKENDWKCANCWVMNKPDIPKCIACSGSKPLNKKVSVTKDYSNVKTPSLFNSTGFNKVEKKSEDSIFFKIMEKQNQRWQCQSCLSSNERCHIKCVCCEAPKPGVNVNEEKAKFNFSATPTFKFGIQASTDTSTKQDVVDSSENNSANLLKIEPNNNIGPKSNAPFSFGIPVAKITTENKHNEDKISKSEPKFAFGVPNQPKTEDTKEALKTFSAVGAVNTTVDNKTLLQEKASEPVTKFIFGVPNKTSVPAKETFKLPENNMFTINNTEPKTHLAITSPIQNSASAGKTAVVAPTKPALGLTTANVTTTSAPKLMAPRGLFTISALNNEGAKPAVTTSEVTTTKAEGFAFKPPIANSNAPFSFSANLSKTTQSVAPNVTTPLFSLASNISKTTANSNLPAATTSAFPVFRAKTETSFTAQTAASQTLASAAPVYSFGSNASAAPKSVAVTPGRYNFSYGGTSNNSTIAPTFNATFGAPTTAVSSTTTNNNGPLMPSTTNLFGSPQPPKNNLFGALSTLNNQNFGATNDKKPPLFAFGGQSNTINVFGAGQQQSANTFGMGNQTQTPASQSGGLFGTPAQNSTPAPTLFGGLQTNNNAPTGMFGSSSLGGTPTFGVPNATPATQTFGAPNTSLTTSPFGAPNSLANQTFGAPNTSLTTPFGVPNSSATPTFGAPNTSLTTSPFGAQNSSATPSFGGPNTSLTTSPFGAPSMQTPVAPPPAYNYGAAPSTQMFPFGQQPAAAPGVNPFGAIAIPNMFNIGTSTGASQQSNIANRRVRKAVRRSTPR